MSGAERAREEVAARAGKRSDRKAVREALEELGIDGEDLEAAILAAVPQGRPRIRLNLEVVEALSKLHLSVSVMAPLLGISKEGLGLRLQKDAKLAEIVEKGKSTGKRILVEAIAKGALSGNAQSQRLLARQWLGWRDEDAREGMGDPGSSEASEALLVQMLQKFTRGEEREAELAEENPPSPPTLDVSPAKVH